MMKLKHNKKRNTAFLYEILIREITKSIIQENQERKNKAVFLIKKYFTKNSYLKNELDLYKSLLETKNLKIYTAEKLLFETKKTHKKIDKKKLFNEQTRLINNINKTIGKNVFVNFVPNYRSLATIYQIFNNEATPTKERVLLEENIINSLSFSSKNTTDTNDIKPIDSLIYKQFVDKFNSTYVNLREEQASLLKHFAGSVNPEKRLELNIYLNEEIGRIKNKLRTITEDNKLEEDIRDKTLQVLSMLENMKSEKITQDTIFKVLQIQELIGEINN